jgi:hypothetical protein
MARISDDVPYGSAMQFYNFITPIPPHKTQVDEWDLFKHFEA